jgi:drug/metabolite transporter (DMT)-like permease
VVAIVLSLGASLAWGISDFLGGLKSRSLPLLAVLLVSQGAALALLAAGVLAFGGDPPAAKFLGYAALAGLGETVGVAALYRGLASGVMTIVAPVAATAPVVPVLAALALGEVPSAIQGAGIALAIGGIVLTAHQPRSEEMTASPIGPSVGFGVLTALGFGSFYVAMDAASEGEIPWALLIARLTSVIVFIAAFLVARPRLSVRRPDLPVLAAIGVLIIAADSMYAIATTHGLLSIVAVLSTLYPVVTIALARQYLDERITGPQLTGIAACLSGAVAISAAA